MDGSTEDKDALQNTLSHFTTDTANAIATQRNAFSSGSMNQVADEDALRSRLSHFTTYRASSEEDNNDVGFTVATFTKIIEVPKARYIDTEFLKDAFFIDASPPRTKLEVMDSRESARILRFLYIMVAVGLVFSIVFLILTQTEYFLETEVQTSPSETQVIEIIVFPESVIVTRLVTSFVLILMVSILFISYVLHLHYSKATKSLLQKLLLGFVPAFITLVLPITQIIAAASNYNTSVDIFSGSFFLQDGYEDLYRGTVIYENIVDTLNEAILILFLASMAYSYRFLHYSGWSMSNFFFTRGFFILVFLVFRFFALFALGINFHISIFLVLPAVIRFSKHMNALQNAVAWMNFSFEFGFILWIAGETYMTHQILKSQSYMRVRTNRIGFHFFLYATIIALVPDYIIRFINGALDNPNQKLLLQTTGYINFGMEYFAYGSQFSFVAYIIVMIYIHLPADVLRLFSYGEQNFHTVETSNAVLRSQQFIMKVLDTEDIDNHRIYVHKKLLTLETLAIMLNFSFLAYRHDTPGMPHYVPTDFEDYEHTIRAKIHDSVTDSHILIIESSKRIIVSFRGTKSVENLKTDAKFKKTMVRKFYDFDKMASLMKKRKREKRRYENDGDNDDDDHLLLGIGKVLNEGAKIKKEGEEDAQEAFRRLQFNRAKVHQGFAEAYLATKGEIMEEVLHAYFEKERQIYVTGHSLGGALATLFAFGLSLEYSNLPPVSVTTFGSPNVGNRWFRDIYERVVQIHWRVVNSQDIITKTPKGFYFPVGTLILFSGEEMFVDPSFFEYEWFHSAGSFARHRLPSYSRSFIKYLEFHHEAGTIQKLPIWDILNEQSLTSPGDIEIGENTDIMEQVRRDILN